MGITDLNSITHDDHINLRDHGYIHQSHILNEGYIHRSQLEKIGYFHMDTLEQRGYIHYNDLAAKGYYSANHWQSHTNTFQRGVLRQKILNAEVITAARKMAEKLGPAEGYCYVGDHLIKTCTTLLQSEESKDIVKLYEGTMNSWSPLVKKAGVFQQRHKINSSKLHHSHSSNDRSSMDDIEQSQKSVPRYHTASQNSTHHSTLSRPSYRSNRNQSSNSSTSQPQSTSTSHQSSSSKSTSNPRYSKNMESGKRRSHDSDRHK